MQDVLGNGTQEEPGQFVVATRANHQRGRSSARVTSTGPGAPSTASPLKTTVGSSSSARRERPKTMASADPWKRPSGSDEAPCRWHLVVRRHHVEQGAPAGSLLDGELDRTGRARRAVGAHDDSKFVEVLTVRVIRFHCRLLGIAVGPVAIVLAFAAVRVGKKVPRTRDSSPNVAGDGFLCGHWGATNVTMVLYADWSEASMLRHAATDSEEEDSMSTNKQTTDDPAGRGPRCHGASRVDAGFLEGACRRIPGPARPRPHGDQGQSCKPWRPLRRSAPTWRGGSQRSVGP